MNKQKKYRKLSIKIIGNVDKNNFILVKMPVEVFEKQILSLQENVQNKPEIKL